jgi:hypothetical protein
VNLLAKCALSGAGKEILACDAKFLNQLLRKAEERTFGVKGGKS